MGTASSIQPFTTVRKLFSALFSATIALLTVSIALTGCTTKTETAQSSAQPKSSPANTTPETIRIGYVRWGLLPIVRQQGNLEQELAKQNIKVQWVGPFPAFAPILEAFNAGEIDISAGGDIPGISGLVGGTPICIIAYQPTIPEAEAILVRSDSALQSPQDLVGKKVAVNRGGWGEHLLLKVLAEAKVSKEQVERVYLSPTDALPAVTQGHVDAWSVWEPNVSIAEVQHKLRPIASGEAASHYGIYVVSRETLADKPAAVGTALEAIAQEAAWAVQQPEQAAEAFGQSTELDAAVVKRLGQNRLVENVLPLTPDVIIGIQERADWMFAQQAIPKAVDISQTICPTTAGLEKYTAATSKK